jgi:putative transferase (TIGR04331 family)
LQRRIQLTATGDSHRDASDALMLGPWCLPTQAIIEGVVVPYHWDDRQKLARDYDYLQGLHDTLLESLTTALNGVHGTACSKRYWQIVLDPWLMSYLAVQFDRWESVRIAFQSGEALETDAAPAAAIAPSFSYSEFVAAAVTDGWNRSLFARIIAFRYPHQRANPAPRLPEQSDASGGSARRRSALHTLAGWLDDALAPFSSNNEVVLLTSYFSARALLALSLRMRLVPRLYLSEFAGRQDEASMQTGRRECDRGAMRIDFAARNDFESYVLAHLQKDLPTCAIEHYGALAARARAVRLHPKLIVCANAHWTHVLAKAWMAHRVEQGTKLAILEHGGSFPAPRELFDFEENIADVRVSWFKPYHPKHVQLPPSKLAGRVAAPRRESRAIFCLVVANENPRFAIRAHFYPMSAQCVRSFDLTTRMIERLDPAAAAQVRIRPATDQGWNFAAAYARRFGDGALYREGTLASAFMRARLIVCTYPETTFSEAMASGAPVVLLYPPEVYERHPIAQGLLTQMRAAGIVFHDAAQAAAHISRIWQHPLAWWQEPRVRAARDAFFETALRIRGDWLGEWQRFLKRTAS